MVDCSFSKQARLLTAADFQAVFANAQYKVSCRYLLFLAIDNLHGSSRLGLVIAKKNVKLAVQRNRLKRLIRESFRNKNWLTKEALSAEKGTKNNRGLDIVVLVRKDADRLNNYQFTDRLEKLWLQLEHKFNTNN